MAQAYITVSDITNRHMAKFPDADKQSYVDIANERFETYCTSLGVATSDIQLPVNSSVRGFIVADLMMEMTRDCIGGIGAGVEADGGLYESIYAHSKDAYIVLKPRIVEATITGVDETKSTLATNWGRVVRG